MSKVSKNSLRSHSTKTSRKHREREYFKLRDFERFQEKVIESVDDILKMQKEAFKRDQFIVENCIRAHFAPSGSGLMVRTEVHEELKDFNEKKIKKGFAIPRLRVHDTRMIEQSVDLSFGGSQKDRIVSINQSPKSKARTGMSSKKLVKLDSSAKPEKEEKEKKERKKSESAPKRLDQKQAAVNKSRP